LLVNQSWIGSAERIAALGVYAVRRGNRQSDGQARAVTNHFEPCRISEYQKFKQELATIDDTARLSELLRQALRAADLTAFLLQLSTGLESEDGRQ
jgi:hypothetical protein